MNPRLYDRATLARRCVLASRETVKPEESLEIANEFIDRFMALVAIADDADYTKLTPSPKITNVWRVALWNLPAYISLCASAVGNIVLFNDTDGNSQRYVDTLGLYRLKFGTPNPAIWPPCAEKSVTSFSQWLLNMGQTNANLGKCNVIAQAPPSAESKKRTADSDAATVPVKRAAMQEEPGKDKPKVPVAADTTRKGSLNLIVKMLSGKNITLDLDYGDLISDVKQQLQDKEGILPDQQRLFCNGEEMDDTKHVRDYPLVSGAAIHIVFKLRGC